MFLYDKYVHRALTHEYLADPDAMQSTMTFFQTSFLNIGGSAKKDYKVSRLMATLLSVWICINLKICANTKVK